MEKDPLARHNKEVCVISEEIGVPAKLGFTSSAQPCTLFISILTFILKIQ